MARITKLTNNANLNKNWQELFDAFITFKRAQGLADRTILDYTKHVRHIYG